IGIDIDAEIHPPAGGWRRGLIGLLGQFESQAVGLYQGARGRGAGKGLKPVGGGGGQPIVMQTSVKEWSRTGRADIRRGGGDVIVQVAADIEQLLLPTRA